MSKNKRDERRLGTDALYQPSLKARKGDRWPIIA